MPSALKYTLSDFKERLEKKQKEYEKSGLRTPVKGQQ
jgi:hypothetical protein